MAGDTLFIRHTTHTCPRFPPVLTVKPWKIESLLQLLLGVFGSITFAGMYAVALGYQARPGQIDHGMMLMGALSVHGVGLLWLDWFIKDHQLTWKEVVCARFARLPAMITLGVAAGAAGFYICMYLGGWVAQVLIRFSMEPEAQSSVIALQSSLSPPWIIFFGVVSIVLAPIVEEILFRGVLYPMVKQLGHPKLAFWGTSLLFAASHANLQAFIPLTVLALGLTQLYQRTNYLIAPIIAHSVFNAINYGLTIHYGAFSAAGS